MLPPSGETRGSVAHSSSNTSMGSKKARSPSAEAVMASIAKRGSVKKDLFIKSKATGKLIILFIQIA
ncbi:MAG: hypothetical protein O3C66_04190 [Proteobacteria bacterium]|nr:hypothetical protein [Pseudomonadota bacterium]MDA0881157.1 hypothetical protein [Pseudomonadota bacterium]